MKQSEKDNVKLQEDLYRTILKLETLDDCKKLFADLCTYKEIDNMAQRLCAAKLLLQGMTYAQVIEETEISSATLSRISRCIQHGSGGYNIFCNKED